LYGSIVNQTLTEAQSIKHDSVVLPFLLSFHSEPAMYVYVTPKRGLYPFSTFNVSHSFFNIKKKNADMASMNTRAVKADDEQSRERYTDSHGELQVMCGLERSALGT
jgi:hypothetical protein